MKHLPRLAIPKMTQAVNSALSAVEFVVAARPPAPPYSMSFGAMPSRSALFRQKFAGGQGKEVIASDLNYSLLGRTIPLDWAT